MGYKHACTFAVDLRPMYWIAQSCPEVSAVFQDHKWYHVTYPLFIFLRSVTIQARTGLLNAAHFSSCEVRAILPRT
jgi:hypothetical protein